MAKRPIYQLYAELDDYKPKIWRRFQVADDVTVARFGYILMTLFEMQASHLFAFDLPKVENFRSHMYTQFTDPKDQKSIEEMALEIPSVCRYEIPDEESDDNVIDARNEKLSDVLLLPGDHLSFNYDFGDDWWILIKLENIIEDKELPARELPRALEGKGYGIIEDCGGTSGLARLAKAFTKKKGKEYDEFREWLGVDDLDMAAFDIDDINFRLKKIPRIYAEMYEFHLEPTKRSIDILERKYLKKKVNASK